MTSRKKS